MVLASAKKFYNGCKVFRVVASVLLAGLPGVLNGFWGLPYGCKSINGWFPNEKLLKHFGLLLSFCYGVAIICCWLHMHMQYLGYLGLYLYIHITIFSGVFWLIARTILGGY